MHKISLAEKFGQFTDHFSPKIVGEVNGVHVKLVKFQGDFVWHSHAAEDEMFLVIRGSFDMHFRDRVETLREGEFIVVPRGVEHKPFAQDEVHLLLVEPASTINTGEVESERTVRHLERL